VVKRPGPGVNHELPTGSQLKNDPYLYTLALPSWRYREAFTYWCMSTSKACIGSFPILNTTCGVAGRVVWDPDSKYRSVRKKQYAALTSKSDIF